MKFFKENKGAFIIPVGILLSFFSPIWANVIAIWLVIALILVAISGVIFSQLATLLKNMTPYERENFERENGEENLKKFKAALAKIRTFTIWDALNICYFIFFLVQGWGFCASALLLLCVSARLYLWNYKLPD